MNPKLYFALYPQNPDGYDEEDLEEFEVPQNEQELAQWMQRLNVQRIS